MPEIEAGLAKAGRDRNRFEVWGGGFIATGKDDAAVAKQLQMIRYRIAFYGSTRSYHGVLAHHGWDDLGMKLHDMSKNGQWEKMAAEVPDDVVAEFTAVGRYDQLADVIAHRFGGISDSITIDFGHGAPPELASELIQDLRRIPSVFAGFSSRW
jgi:alkanesulfonate monooxygenase SsuD/methylene tetrahydromethanopterin reductase-like flavin-dependent oxidoreductase (luciferase family)